MTADRDLASMQDMLDHACRAQSLVEGKTQADIESDWVVNLALIRLLEVVGEAASRVSQETRRRLTSIPWGDVVGMRNRLVHGYDVVDQRRLWDTLTNDVPVLIDGLRQALPAEEQ